MVWRGGCSSESTNRRGGSGPGVSQAAVIGIPHDIKGQAFCCFTTLTMGYEENEELIKELKALVRKSIGPFATPNIICPFYVAAK